MARIALRQAAWLLKEKTSTAIMKSSAWAFSRRITDPFGTVRPSERMSRTGTLNPCSISDVVRFATSILLAGT
jgi:hypothetical protein